MKSLKEETLKRIVKIILDYKGAERIVIFGSRASDECKETSDIDIAIFGKDWTDRDVNVVKNRLDESIKTALKFDVVNFYGLAKDKLKENILKEGKVIYDSGKD